MMCVRCFNEVRGSEARPSEYTSRSDEDCTRFPVGTGLKPGHERVRLTSFPPTAVTERVLLLKPG